MAALQAAVTSRDGGAGRHRGAYVIVRVNLRFLGLVVLVALAPSLAVGLSGTTPFDHPTSVQFPSGAWISCPVRSSDQSVSSPVSTDGCNATTSVVASPAIAPNGESGWDDITVASDVAGALLTPEEIPDDGSIPGYEPSIVRNSAGSDQERPRGP